MNILETAMSILSESDFDIRQQSDLTDSFQFENETIMGLFSNYSTVDEMLESWFLRQSDFLNKYAPIFRKSGEKAWNIYTVYATSDECSFEKLAQLNAIEENFDSTRKIARTGLVTANDIKTILLPILPIQSLIRVAETDIISELKSRLDLDDKAKEALLGTSSAREFAERVLNNI